jgi:hypothetical protein
MTFPTVRRDGLDCSALRVENVGICGSDPIGAHVPPSDGVGAVAVAVILKAVGAKNGDRYFWWGANLLEAANTRRSHISRGGFINVELPK